jgi:prepilin signal peptidase PulO-like enzyme (type II secretory pathway)
MWASQKATAGHLIELVLICSKIFSLLRSWAADKSQRVHVAARLGSTFYWKETALALFVTIFESPYPRE